MSGADPPYTRDHLAALVAEAGFDIGAHSYGRPTVHWWGEPGRLTIGRYCSIAEGVEIFLGGNHRTDWVTTYPFSQLPAWPEAKAITGHPATKGDVLVGNDVWLGRDAVILSGVTIGDGAVVGASAVVARDVPAYAIVAGNPARILRYRFPADIVEALRRVGWWNWPDEEVRAAIPRLLSGDVPGFLAAAGVEPPRGRGRIRFWPTRFWPTRFWRGRGRLPDQQP